MKVLTIVENTSTGGKLRAEHGLSVLIENKGQYVLFDTGQTNAIIDNALYLGVDLKKINFIVLSHGHYDHVGGLKYVLEQVNAPIFSHPEIFRKRYSKKDNNFRYIGIETEEFFKNLNANFNFHEGPIEVTSDIFTTGYVELKTEFEEVDKDFVYEKDGKYIKDDVPDDLSLVLNLKRGLFIVFGCAHRGIINIINHCESVFGKKVIGFIGGTHLGPASPNQKEKTIEALKKMPQIELIGPSHCTGIKMTCRLSCEFGSKVFYNNVGSYLELGE